MVISKANLMKEIQPALDKLFQESYAEHSRAEDTGWFESYYIIKKNHKYQVWLCGDERKKLVAKNIQHRREAIALIKLLNATKE